MNLEQFEHVLRAAAGITGETVFVVVGSQAVLAQYPDAPANMLRSVELDLYPKFRPDLAEVIEGAIGADSVFHGTFGYHADGVGPETSRLPGEWEKRAFRFSGQGGVIAICPDIHDLAISKLLAGREKDIAWVRAAFQASLIVPSRLLALTAHVEASPQERSLLEDRIERLSGGGV